MLSIDETIAREKANAEIQRIDNDNCKYKSQYGCKDCVDYYYKSCIECAEEHEQLAEWLEELKTIKEMDLDIPQHFTKEQSAWIKAYCIKRNIEFYNNAIDDFAEKVIQRYHELPTTLGYTEEIVKEIAEQLKAGEQNEQSI